MTYVYLYDLSYTFSLVADEIYFNSKFNMSSFIQNIKSFIKKMPDYKPTDVDKEIQDKSKVLYFPVCFPDVEKLLASSSNKRHSNDVIHFVWPHRWY